MRCTFLFVLALTAPVLGQSLVPATVEKAERDTVIDVLAAKVSAVYVVPESVAGITQAADDIDRHLSQRPRDCDEFRDDGFLFLNVGPINVVYDVSEDDRKVVVVRVWLAEFE